MKNVKLECYCRFIVDGDVIPSSKLISSLSKIADITDELDNSSETHCIKCHNRRVYRKESTTRCHFLKVIHNREPIIRLCEWQESEWLMGFQYDLIEIWQHRRCRQICHQATYEVEVESLRCYERET